MTIDNYIQIIARSYFTAWIIMESLYAIYTFSDDYKEIKKIRIQQGKHLSSFYKTLIALTLFILSCYLK